MKKYSTSCREVVESSSCSLTCVRVQSANSFACTMTCGRVNSKSMQCVMKPIDVHPAAGYQCVFTKSCTLGPGNVFGSNEFMPAS